jgi:hypothetical protein
MSAMMTVLIVKVSTKSALFKLKNFLTFFNLNIGTMILQWLQMYTHYGCFKRRHMSFSVMLFIEFYIYQLVRKI